MNTNNAIVNSTAGYTLPVSTSRVHGPWTVNTGVKNDTMFTGRVRRSSDQHGP